MKRLLLAGLLSLAVCSFVTPAAADPLFDPAPILQPTMEIFASLAATLITALVSGILARWFKNSGETLDASKRQVLHDGILNLAQYAFGQIKAGKINTHSELLATILTGVQDHYPDALKYFGLMTSAGKVNDQGIENIVRMIESRLAGLGYVATPDSATPVVPAPTPAPVVNVVQTAPVPG